MPQWYPLCMPPYLRAEQRLSFCYHQTSKSKQDALFYPWLIIWPMSIKWVGSTIHLSDEFRYKDKINFCNDYNAIICETFTLCIYFKRRNSTNGKKIREWGKMVFFASIDFGHNFQMKASTLKLYKAHLG